MSKTFPTLYSRASTGALQQWTIQTEGNSFFTESGQVGGVITRSEPTICQGKNKGKKNETTGEEQALLEAQSKFDKKSKTGYFENKEDVDKMSYIEPMLAKNYKDRKGKVSFPVLVQKKYNGGRCVATKDGLFSRKGEKYMTCPHIEKSLKEYFTLFPESFLDSELMGLGFSQSLNETMKLIRKSVHITEEDLKKSKELVRLFVYDGLPNNTKASDPYSVRKYFLDSICGQFEFLETVPTYTCNTEAELMKKYEEFVKEGEEGAIVRFPDSPYEFKRSSLLLKLKPTDTDEFEITDIQEGSGNWAGKAKIICLKDKNGKEFDACFKGSMEQAKETLDNKKDFIGKIVTISYNGTTGLGCPNYAQFDINNYMHDK